MDNSATEQYLKDSIQSIIDDYELFHRIGIEMATDDDVERMITDFHADRDAIYLDDDHTEIDWQALQDHAAEVRDDYPLSVDDSHIWFTLGGPNISANVTGWSIIGEDYPVIDVQDITLKGRWGGASVDREIYYGEAAFEYIAEMFETNLLSKFSRF